MAHNNTIFIARLLLAAGCSFLFPSIYSPPAPKNKKQQNFVYTILSLIIYNYYVDAIYVLQFFIRSDEYVQKALLSNQLLSTIAQLFEREIDREKKNAR